LVGFWILKSMFLVPFLPRNFSGETESFIWVVWWVQMAVDFQCVNRIMVEWFPQKLAAIEFQL
jgi:hypothetical protein